MADYPFTTLMPNLGVVQGKEDFEVDADYEGLGGGQRAVLADLPGLIEGAHAVSSRPRGSHPTPIKLHDCLGSSQSEVLAFMKVGSCSGARPST